MINIPLFMWFSQMRTINWNLKLGFQSTAVVSGSFRTSPLRLNSQGEYWGHTYVRALGYHYDDYSSGRIPSMALAGTLAIPKSVTALSMARQENKTAAPNVTGLIGELLVAAFFQRVMKLENGRLAHIKEADTKSPDYATSANPLDWSALIAGNYRLRVDPPVAVSYAATLARLNWGTEPIPVEVKTRLAGTRDPLSGAFTQLKSYWTAYPKTAGIGQYFEVDLLRTNSNRTTLNIRLFALKQGYNSETVQKKLETYADYKAIKKYLNGGVLIGTP